MRNLSHIRRRWFGIVGLCFLLWLTADRRAGIQPSIPHITRVDPPIIFCEHECVVGGMKVSGQSFAVGQIIEVGNGKVLEARFVSATEIRLTLSFDEASFSPGWIRIRVISKMGASNPIFPAFAGRGNILAEIGSQCFILDQAASVVHVRDCPASNSPVHVRDGRSDHACFLGASHANGFAVDKTTGLIVVTKSTGVLIVRPKDCRILQVVDRPWAGDVAALNGLACFVQPETSQMSCINLKGIVDATNR
jgi:hypothetical protein